MEALNQDEAFEPGNVLRDTAAALGGWQAAHQASLSPREWDELDEREIKLLNSASSMYTGAAGAATSGDVAGIPAAVVSLEDAAATILFSSDSDG